MRPIKSQRRLTFSVIQLKSSRKSQNRDQCTLQLKDQHNANDIVESKRECTQIDWHEIVTKDELEKKFSCRENPRVSLVYHPFHGKSPVQVFA